MTTTEKDPVKILQQFEDKGFNITPPIKLEGLLPHLKASVETCLLSADINDRDVYPHGDAEKTKPENRRFRLSKQALDKLSFRASVKWHEEFGSKRLDDGENRDYVAFQAYAGVRKANDSWIAVKAYYDLDLIVLKEDLVDQYTAKGKKYKKTGAELDEYVDFCVNRDMRKKYKHRATLCESGATSRVLRKLLGIKGTYTFKELQNPFVCPSVTDKIDYEDPSVKLMIAQERIGAQSRIYGSTPIKQIDAPKKVISEDQTVTDDDVPEEDIDTEPNGVDSEEEPGTDEDFDNWDRESREKYLKNLCKKIPYDLSALLGRMENVSSLADVSDVQLSAMKDKFSKMPIEDIPY